MATSNSIVPILKIKKKKKDQDWDESFQSELQRAKPVEGRTALSLKPRAPATSSLPKLIEGYFGEGLKA